MERMIIGMEQAREIIEKIKSARTWKEAEVSMAEVVNILNDLMNSNGEVSDSAEIRRLKSKIDRLTESNKQLMAENKKFKGNK